MASIKPLNVIADKYSRNAATAGPSYKQGIENPRESWATNTAAADESRKAGLAAADARDAFKKGVTEAGDAKWRSNALAKGPTRFAQGVQLAKPAYTQGFSASHAVISSVNLPPRGPKGSPENLNRVSAITTALHDAATK